MDRVELADFADQLVESYRSSLLIDPFFKVSVEVVAGATHSECAEDSSSSLAWIIKLDPEKHNDVYDVQYSVVESLLKIIMTPLFGNEKEGIIARIATSICNESNSDDDEEEDDDEY